MDQNEMECEKRNEIKQIKCHNGKLVNKLQRRQNAALQFIQCQHAIGSKARETTNLNHGKAKRIKHVSERVLEVFITFITSRNHHERISTIILVPYIKMTSIQPRS